MSSVHSTGSPIMSANDSAKFSVLDEHDYENMGVSKYVGEASVSHVQSAQHNCVWDRDNG